MQKKYMIPKTISVERNIFTENYVTGKQVLNIGVGGAIIDKELKEVFLKSDITNTFHTRLSTNAKSITNLEIEQDNIDKFQQSVPGRYIKGDITDPNLLNIINEKFELIVFTEIIEHIDCYRVALQNLHKLLSPNGEVLISTINAYNPFSIIKLLFRYESNHIEHTAYFSYLTLKRLLYMNGFTISKFYFAYDQKGGIFKRIVKGLQIKLFPQFSQGILLVARPKQESDSLIPNYYTD